MMLYRYSQWYWNNGVQHKDLYDSWCMYSMLLEEKLCSIIQSLNRQNIRVEDGSWVWV